jgi:hypothetical protein
MSARRDQLIEDRRESKIRQRLAGRKTGRVLLQRPKGVDDFGSRTVAAPAGDMSSYVQESERGIMGPRRVYPIVRLTEDGIAWGEEPQPGDEIGYGMHPYLLDDCVQAAIATVTQIPIEQVPDLKLNARLLAGEDPDEISRTSWDRIAEWADKRGLVCHLWSSELLPVPRRRWIGLVRSLHKTAYTLERGQLVKADMAAFHDHCLVMARNRLLFDPSCSVRPPPGFQTLGHRPEHVSEGISFDRKE